MAIKVAIVNGAAGTSNKSAPPKRQDPNPAEKVAGFATSTWSEFTRFLSDVRAEMRKVVTPSRKEVEATTTVVLVAVFLFGVYFFAVDAIFQYGLHALLGKLGGF
jgi:preprotein translocase subunit SecE